MTPRNEPPAHVAVQVLAVVVGVPILVVVLVAWYALLRLNALAWYVQDAMAARLP